MALDIPVPIRWAAPLLLVPLAQVPWRFTYPVSEPFFFLGMAVLLALPLLLPIVAGIKEGSGLTLGTVLVGLGLAWVGVFAVVGISTRWLWETHSFPDMTLAFMGPLAIYFLGCAGLGGIASWIGAWRRRRRMAEL